MIKNGYKPINLVGAVPIRSNDIFVLGFVVYLLDREHGRLLDHQALSDKFTPSNN